MDQMLCKAFSFIALVAVLFSKVEPVGEVCQRPLYRVGSHVVFAWIQCTDVRIHCTDILIECR